MIGTLVAHTGAVKVSRRELDAIEPPAATRTWKPVRHGELVDALEAELCQRDLQIREEAYAVQRDGALLFGVIDLFWRKTEEFAAAIGLRTANDKTMSIQIAMGFRVFVCDNLVFSGDLIALRRKHTSGLDLQREIARSIDRYQEGVLTLERGIEQLRNSELVDSKAKELIFDVFDQAILPTRFFGAVSEAYFTPEESAVDCLPRSLWGLHNAITRQVRKLSPGPAFRTTARLGKLFGLGHAAN